MNIQDVVKYGHQTVLRAIDGLPDSAWETPGVCGYWSTKQILAHLSSYECALVEILSTFLDGGATPTFDEFRSSRRFNDDQVDRRKDLSVAEVLAEYTQAHANVVAGLARLSANTLSKPGTLPWHGAEYALDDFIVYSFYGHKREHCAQIAVFRDGLEHSPGS
jgi:uncharacterized damage-inducible protein DinB